MRINRTLALSWALIMAPVIAAAQAPPTPATPPAQTAPPAPSPAAANCAPQQPSHPGVAGPEGTTTGQALGDKLAKSDGVLCPPAGVDPEMRAPTPQGGNTPVIPPPGSPGGDPSVRPK
ncbi:hypothetical protein HAP47_0033115 [Bradyrhizobium sp. 41S5]|uniref:hypothetical protein n=1 Tax=Bradyrhizobium sp. 41S5 TaxID=1404443 RepID=UPI00156AD1DF|nr:hypothetical protein [Bradyrhizobium sp. 41S5]UFX43996.1 hypothetical protein HAP47_0033115 [Bradyrhizobium sp. 41S5]